MRQIKDIIVEELRNDADLRLVHLEDAISCFFSGDKKTALLMFRNIVNATCGFYKMSAKTGIPDKSLMRMLSSEGNPQTDNLIQIISFLFKQEDIETFELKRA